MWRPTAVTEAFFAYCSLPAGRKFASVARGQPPGPYCQNFVKLGSMFTEEPAEERQDDFFSPFPRLSSKLHCMAPVCNGPVTLYLLNQWGHFPLPV